MQHQKHPLWLMQHFWTVLLWFVTAKTFLNYAEQVFFPLCISTVRKYQHSRVDIVWDVYQTDSLKGTTRQKRRAKVYGEELFPRQRFQRTGRIFLRVDDNKMELFSFSSHQVTLLQRERAKHCTQLMAMMCFALWHKLT